MSTFHHHTGLNNMFAIDTISNILLFVNVLWTCWFHLAPSLVWCELLKMGWNNSGVSQEHHHLLLKFWKKIDKKKQWSQQEMQTTCSSHGACLGGDKVHLYDSSINSCSAPVLKYDKILLHLHWPVLV